jgi:hypothetical protein
MLREASQEVLRGVLGVMLGLALRTWLCLSMAAAHERVPHLENVLRHVMQLGRKMQRLIYHTTTARRDKGDQHKLCICASDVPEKFSATHSLP